MFEFSLTHKRLKAGRCFLKQGCADTNKVASRLCKEEVGSICHWYHGYVLEVMPLVTVIVNVGGQCDITDSVVDTVWVIYTNGPVKRLDRKKWLQYGFIHA